jgi:hypothetical protein
MNPEMIEPSAGCSWETRTPAGMADAETSLTAFVAVDMSEYLSGLRRHQSNKKEICRIPRP